MAAVPQSVTTSAADSEAARSARDTATADARASAPWPVRDETIEFPNIVLENGAEVPRLRVRYRLEGALSPERDNLVLVVHALTGTVHASDWWKGVIGEGCAIDPTRHAVLCANLLGGCTGTTGPTNAAPDALPAFTTRDQAMVLARLLDALGVHRPLLVAGGSLGGMVTLEFAAGFPERVRKAVVLAAPAAQTAQGIVWGAIMQRAIAVAGVQEGLALARMVGMLSYRTPEGLERRFGRARSAEGAFLVSEWLSNHGERLVERFDAMSYVALLRAMDTHDIGRGRGGVAAALAPVADRITGVGIPGDLLYPADTVREWTTRGAAGYVDLPSIHGHDAFLLETSRVSAILREALSRASAHSEVQGGAVRDVPRVYHEHARDNARPAAARTSTRTVRVALAGCGHVGGSLLDLIGERTTGDEPGLQVVRVLVRDAFRARPALAHAIARGIAPGSACITNPAALLYDDIDVLVEAIGGTTTARVLVETALQRGVRVVTANKALLAEHGVQLDRLARRNGTRIDFEGAVAGAIPVVRCLRSGAAGVGVTRITGILNGTSNFVLARVADGQSLDDAIATAQELGYAEADPTRDLSGADAEDKLRVLAWLAFGADPSTLKVARHGIDAKTAAWAVRAAVDGDRVKLLASCAREGDELVARIVPTRVPADDPWANVTGAFNRIVIESASAGALVFHGPGAGGRATAGAVLGDLLTPG